MASETRIAFLCSRVTLGRFRRLQFTIFFSVVVPVVSLTRRTVRNCNCNYSTSMITMTRPGLNRCAMPSSRRCSRSVPSRCLPAPEGCARYAAHSIPSPPVPSRVAAPRADRAARPLPTSTQRRQSDLEDRRGVQRKRAALFGPTLSADRDLHTTVRRTQQAATHSSQRVERRHVPPIF